MPRHREAKKDAANSEMRRLAVSMQRSVDVRMGEPTWSRDQVSLPVPQVLQLVIQPHIAAVAAGGDPLGIVRGDFFAFQHRLRDTDDFGFSVGLTGHSTNMPTTIIATTLAVFPEALRETLFLLLSIYCTAQAVTFRLLLQAGRCPLHPGAHNGSSGCSRCQSRRRRWHPGAGRRS